MPSGHPAFQDAILREPGLFRDAVVLDLTAALGLFSLWAVRRAGARRAIVVVDHPEDARHAREFARHNKMASRVTVVVGPIEAIELQEEKVSSSVQPNIRFTNSVILIRIRLDVKSGK